jgi:hypothetical protein
VITQTENTDLGNFERGKKLFEQKVGKALDLPP